MRVIVNPNYRSEGWFDPKSGMTFRKSDGEITIPEDVESFNIKRYITLNYLLVVEDEKAEEEETLQELVVKTPAQLLVEEEKEVQTPETEEAFEPEEEDIPTEDEEDPNICRFCGKELKSLAGRLAHERSCKQNPEN